jgi:DNA-binding transcriptional LysR family regulator
LPTELDETLGALRVDEIHSFVVLSEELHFTRAAERLAVTPGGLSRRIARLERPLGATLLHRTTRSVGLTPYGRRLVPAARRLIADVHALPEGINGSPRSSGR